MSEQKQTEALATTKSATAKGGHAGKGKPKHRG